MKEAASDTGRPHASPQAKGLRAVHGKGHKFKKKVIRAVREARRRGFAALAVVVDRDREPDSERIDALQAGRDSVKGSGLPPCAVGTPIETFDAWMICDAEAIAAAGGDPDKAPSAPESLTGKKGSVEHPKTVANRVFGTSGGTGLGEKYADVAAKIDLRLLDRSCPQGFAPFAAEVRERIGPVVKGAADKQRGGGQ